MHSRAMRSISFVVTPGTAACLEDVERLDDDAAGARHRLELAPGLLDAHARTSTAPSSSLKTTSMGRFPSTGIIRARVR